MLSLLKNICACVTLNIYKNMKEDENDNGLETDGAVSGRLLE